MDGTHALSITRQALWRSVKYEEVYLHAHQSVSAARHGIARYMQFFNTQRPHSALDRRTPDTVSSLHCRSRRQPSPAELHSSAP